MINEPAFPFSYVETDPNYPPETKTHAGMSLRDYFAGQALVGMGTWMPNPSGMLAAPSTQEARARWAYAQADAMLLARSPQEITSE